jgi:hypothetical protein
MPYRQVYWAVELLCHYNIQLLTAIPATVKLAEPGRRRGASGPTAASEPATSSDGGMPDKGSQFGILPFSLSAKSRTGSLGVFGQERSRTPYVEGLSRRSS